MINNKKQKQELDRKFFYLMEEMNEYNNQFAQNMKLVSELKTKIIDIIVNSKPIKEEDLILKANVKTKVSNNEEIKYKMVYNLDGTININLKEFKYINYEDEYKEYKENGYI